MYIDQLRSLSDCESLSSSKSLRQSVAIIGRAEKVMFSVQCNTFLSMYACMHACMYLSIYECTYVCMFICMHVGG